MTAEQARKITTETLAARPKLNLDLDLVYERIEEAAKDGRNLAYIRAVDLNGVSPADARRELEAYQFSVSESEGGRFPLIVSW